MLLPYVGIAWPIATAEWWYTLYTVEPLNSESIGKGRLFLRFSLLRVTIEEYAMVHGVIRVRFSLLGEFIIGGPTIIGIGMVMYILCMS